MNLLISKIKSDAVRRRKYEWEKKSRGWLSLTCFPSDQTESLIYNFKIEISKAFLFSCFLISWHLDEIRYGRNKQTVKLNYTRDWLATSSFAMKCARTSETSLISSSTYTAGEEENNLIGRCFRGRVKQFGAKVKRPVWQIP